MNTIAPTLVLAAFLAAPAAHAGYYATGPIKGVVCSGIVVKSCSPHVIAAVKGKDGNLYEMTNYFDTVTEYRPKTGRCAIRIKSGSIALTTMLAESVSSPTFYEEVDGDFKNLRLATLRFRVNQNDLSRSSAAVAGPTRNCDAMPRRRTSFYADLFLDVYGGLGKLIWRVVQWMRRS